MTTVDVLVILAVSGVGAFIQGSVGFGLNLVAAPVFALVDERMVPGPAIAAAGLMVVMMLWRDRHGVHMGEVGVALIGRVPGTIAAAVTVALLPAEPLAVFFALLVLAAVALSASRLRLSPDRRSLIIAGTLSGYMGTATSIGGPPMAILYAGEDGRRMRGTLAGFFATGIVLSIAALAIAGEFGLEEARLSLLPLPGIVVGFAPSAWGAKWLDAGYTRPAVLLVSALSALSLLGRTVL